MFSILYYKMHISTYAYVFTIQIKQLIKCKIKTGKQHMYINSMSIKEILCNYLY